MDHVLTSETFARSERARDLLRYLVTQDLAGHADRLKGFSIAVDVFGRDEKFDPSTDTVVRVQAGRLRDLLDQYYALEGAHAALRITVPRGSYVPRYVIAPPSTETASVEGQSSDQHPEARPPPTPQIETRHSRWSPARMGVAAGLLALLAGAGWMVQQGAGITDDGEGRATDPAITQIDLAGVTGSSPRAFLPSVYLDDGAADGEDGERLASMLRRGLSGFDTISFLARAPGEDGRNTHARTDHLIVVESGDEEEAQIELQNLATGKVLLSETLPEASAGGDILEDAVADLLTTVAPVGGVIYAALAEEGAETVVTQCLILNDHFYRDQNAEGHRAAYECLEDLTKNELRFSLVYAELAGLHMQAMVSGYDYPPGPTEAQALGFARMAVQLGPNSPSAHRAMGYVLSRMGDAEEALRWTRKAYELNTFDMGMAASYGYAQVFAGDYDAGVPILKRAVTAASSHPTWWDYGLALGRFMQDDMQAASNAAAALASSDRAHYLALRLVTADAMDRTDDVAALRDRITTEHPDFVADLDAFYRRGTYPPAMAERLVNALRRAGLVGAS
ncbi:hypothetical protein AAFN84_02470 [Mesorhizobium sp. CAU 1741]